MFNLEIKKFVVLGKKGKQILIIESDYFSRLNLLILYKMSLISRQYLK